ncbi:MAG: hypothetical protein WKG07_34095 [Hymenobacter sp.]
MGQPIAGGVVAEVVASCSEALPVGSVVVSGYLLWQEFSVADANTLSRVPAEKALASYFLGLLGMPGLTAYFGLRFDICQPRPAKRWWYRAWPARWAALWGSWPESGVAAVSTAGSNEKVAYLKELGFTSYQLQTCRISPRR